MNISLALSGGGFRATVFHLGVLGRLACSNKLEDVALLSTVSGGSLCAGLIFALNKPQGKCEWPSSAAFIDSIEPQAHQLLTSFDMQGSLIQRAFGTFWTLLETRASILSMLMQKHWHMTDKLKDLPEHPRWMINTTCYETGKNWRFEREQMGDYLFGYSHDTDLPLSDAVAASAGFPGLIGALTLKTTGRKWFQYQNAVDGDDEKHLHKIPIEHPRYEEVHLWDGGVYDNHGLEGIYDPQKGWSNRFGFLIVSDAAGQGGEERYRKGIPALMRLSSGIMMNQVRSLRTRMILARLQERPQKDQGVFLQMGNTCEYILKNNDKAALMPQFQDGLMPVAEVTSAANTPTVIRKLSEQEYERLYHHGYEVADATLFAYYQDDYPHVRYEH